METINIKLVLTIVLAAAIVLLVVVLLFQRKRRIGGSHRSSYIDALYALIEHRSDDALRLLTKAVRNGEDDFDAYLQLGNLLRDKNQPEKALQIHRNLTVRRDLGYEEEKAVQLAMAEDLSELGKVENSIHALESVYGKKKDRDIAITLHRLYHRIGDYDNAYSMLKDLSRLNDGITAADRAGYLTTVAQMSASGGKTGEADRYLDLARKEDNKSAPALYLAGKLAMEKGEMTEASKVWEKLLHIDIMYFSDIISHLERVLYEAGKFQELERILLDLDGAHPSRPEIIAALASLYERKGETHRAIQILDDDRKAVLADPAASIKLAALYLHAGDSGNARKVLEEIDVSGKRGGGYRCVKCGATSEVPLSYCSQCFGLNTFTRYES